MANITKKDNRSRNWAFVAYPESMPENWRDILTALGLTWACSPLHDKDIDENAEGGPAEKKAHRHFILKFEGKKSYEQVKEITDLLHATIPQVCKNVVGNVRYFLHRDNPEKAQYLEADIMEGGGFDAFQYLAMSPAQQRAVAMDILRYCRENGIDEMCVLNDYILDEREEWFSAYTTYNSMIHRTLRSRKCMNDEMRRREN